MQLTDPGLGHSENLTDLGRGQCLEVVQGDDDPVPFRKLLDRRHQDTRISSSSSTSPVAGAKSSVTPSSSMLARPV